MKGRVSSSLSSFVNVGQLRLARERSLREEENVSHVSMDRLSALFSLMFTWTIHFDCYPPLTNKIHQRSAEIRHDLLRRRNQ